MFPALRTAYCFWLNITNSHLPTLIYLYWHCIVSIKTQRTNHCKLELPCLFVPPCYNQFTVCHKNYYGTTKTASTNTYAATDHERLDRRRNGFESDYPQRFSDKEIAWRSICYRPAAAPACQPIADWPSRNKKNAADNRLWDACSVFSVP